MDETTVREKLRTYITANIIRDADYDLEDDEGLVTEGLMDSFSIAEVGAFIEREFGLYIPDPELTVDNMNTLDLIVARVMRDRT